MKFNFSTIKHFFLTAACFLITLLTICCEGIDKTGNLSNINSASNRVTTTKQGGWKKLPPNSVGRIKSGVRILSNGTPSDLDDSPYLFQNKDLINTDITGEAELNFLGCASIYIFNNSGLQGTSCPKSGLGGQACMLSGAIGYAGKCLSKIKFGTESAEINLEGTDLDLVYFPSFEITVLHLREGKASLTPIIARADSNNKIRLGEPITLEPKQFVYTQPGENPEPIEGIPQRKSINQEELPKLLNVLGVEIGRDLFRVAKERGLGTAESEQKPIINISPVNHDFSEQSIESRGDDLEVSIKNDGLQPLIIKEVVKGGKNSSDFEITGNDCLGEGKEKDVSRCNLKIIFKPGSLGGKNGFVEIHHNAENSPSRINLTGTGILKPKPPQDLLTPNINLIPSNLDFGFVDAGQRATVDIRITNPSTVPLNITGASLTRMTHPGAFRIIENDCLKLSSTGTCTISVEFVPKSDVTSSAALQIEHNANRGISTVNLKGTGRGSVPGGIGGGRGGSPGGGAGQGSVNNQPGNQGAADIVIDQELPFTDTEVGKTAASQVIIKNLGVQPMSVEKIDWKDSEKPPQDFEKENNCVGKEIGPRQDCRFEVRFKPKTEGIKEAEIQIMHNAPGDKNIVHLKGTGTRRELIFPTLPPDLNFGNQKLNTLSEEKRIQLVNSNSVPLLISYAFNTNTGGHYLKGNTCNDVIEPNKTCDVWVKFNPNTETELLGSLEITLTENGKLENPRKKTLPPIKLIGRGAVPVATASDDEFCFTAAKVAKPDKPVDADERNLIITSKVVPLTITSVEITADEKGTSITSKDFTVIENNCLSPDGTKKDVVKECQVRVKITPSRKGLRQGTLKILHDGSPKSPIEVKLQGAGKSRNWLVRRVFDPIGNLFTGKKDPCKN